MDITFLAGLYLFYRIKWIIQFIIAQEGGLDDKVMAGLTGLLAIEVLIIILLIAKFRDLLNLLDVTNFNELF